MPRFRWLSGRLLLWGAGLAVSALGAGCAAGPPLRADASLPGSARVDGVPVVRQTRNHCGPAALAMVLAWAGQPVTPAELAGLVYLPGRKGTLPIDLSRELRGRGLLAYRVKPALEAALGEVAAGHPVLVLENRGLSWAPVWHYSVLVGFDREAGEAVLHAGGNRPEAVALGTFRRTWSRGGSFGLAALPAGRLPAADDPDGILEALADLEAYGRPGAARPGYLAFTTRWPGDWRGWFGLANAWYAAGDRPGARAALERARSAAPRRPEPVNNLAWLAWDDGRRDDALALAREAAALAETVGADPAPYRDTLDRMLQGE